MHKTAKTGIIPSYRLFVAKKNRNGEKGELKKQRKATATIENQETQIGKILLSALRETVY